MALGGGRNLGVKLIQAGAFGRGLETAKGDVKARRILFPDVGF